VKPSMFPESITKRIKNPDSFNKYVSFTIKMMHNNSKETSDDNNAD